MKRIGKWMVLSALLSLILWFLGGWISGLAQVEETNYQKAAKDWRSEIASLGAAPSKIREIDKKIAEGKNSAAIKSIKELIRGIPGLEGQADYREAEISYKICDKHAAGFIYFLESGDNDQAGEERDSAADACKTSYELMEKLSHSKTEHERFYAFYALGNTNVRRAMIAVSLEEQINALREAIEAYKAALLVKDDYQAKVNLELLLTVNERARQAAAQGKNPLSPENFRLRPKGSNAAPGSRGKSKL